MNDPTIELTVNGQAVRTAVPARTSLADLLRDHLKLTGTHLGCEQGVCGACTVLVDELPVRSCLTLAASCHEKEIVTVEGLEGEDVDRLRDCFSTHGALQCGFCTAGMLVTGYELVRRRTELDRPSICSALSGNICRCTGYNGLVKAIEEANRVGLKAESAPAS